MKKIATPPEEWEEISRPELTQKTRAWLDMRREEIRAAFLASGDAGAMLAAWSEAIDRVLIALMAQQKPAGITLVATGGYGRGELYPYSDIDLMFLYDKAREKEAAGLAEFVFYTLWDVGLAVGQAARTPDEATELAKGDITIRTALIDARMVAGDKAFFARWQKRFWQEVVKGSELAFVEAKLAERDIRHKRFGDSRYMLEPNVKEGKGGLRDTHTLWWLMRYVHPLYSMKELVTMKLMTREEMGAFEQARQFLARVRIHLHYLAGRAEEQLSFDRQQALAQLMGYGHKEPHRAVLRFMRRYFAAVRTVGGMTRIVCALLEEEHKRAPRRPLDWLKQMPFALSGFSLIGERLSVRHPQAFARNPLLMLELFRTAQASDLDIHPRALRLLARNLHRIDAAMRRDPKANAIFVSILLAPKGVEATLRRMSEAGVLGKFIPDFARVVGHTQFNLYHTYTVDEHTLVALGILQSLEQGALKADMPLASEVVRRISMRRALTLALFCHDIAKGRAGDHSALGEKIAASLARRFGFSAAETETAAWLVRHHLLFTHTVFKRDMGDPKTVADFVALVQTPERLKLLLVLTVADMRAVRPGVWNAWKAALLRELYRRAEQAMGAGPGDAAPREAEKLKVALLGLLPPREVERYMAQGDPGFWAGTDAAHHAAIARMLGQMEGEALLIDTGHDYERSVSEMIVMAPDRKGLFALFAGAIALSGANIVSAKIFTLKNGMAVDLFQFQDASGEVFDRPDRLAKLSIAINQALSGELDLPEEFARRQARAIKTKRGAATTGRGQVFIENDASHIYTVIEVAGQDKSGFLYRVTHAIAELGLSIATAQVATYGTQVADVFYVKDNFGLKITHEGKLAQIREKLLEVMES